MTPATIPETRLDSVVGGTTTPKVRNERRPR
jgi:hypothetical protein